MLFIPGLGNAFVEAPAKVNLKVLYLGLFPTLIPYFCIAYVTSKVGASEATSVLYLTPAFAILISWVWLGEIPTIVTLIGVGITNKQVEDRHDIEIKQQIS